MQVYHAPCDSAPMFTVLSHLQFSRPLQLAPSLSTLARLPALQINPWPGVAVSRRVASVSALAQFVKRFNSLGASVSGCECSALAFAAMW